ncbi:hypothetical protein [Oryzifoliimicrobium ureilyticus]|uniref:hypothetical protein n=1 Tax=Oryzifoliimicrobium ureilyticus TaxID=3113724 RepID=UPI0030760346
MEAKKQGDAGRRDIDEEVTPLFSLSHKIQSEFYHTEIKECFMTINHTAIDQRCNVR